MITRRDKRDEHTEERYEGADGLGSVHHKGGDTINSMCSV
jgi:hypothetical protein